MTTNLQRYTGSHQENNLATIFTDYEDLHDVLRGQHGSPLLVILQLVDAARRQLRESLELQTVHLTAYADFGALGANGIQTQQRLHEQDIESRYVHAAGEDNRVEMQICIDAVDTLHRFGIGTFVLMTGRRGYHPLVQQLRRHGKQVIVYSLAPPTYDHPTLDSVTYLPLLDLLGADARSQLPSIERIASKATFSTDGAAYQTPAKRAPHRDITDDGLLKALHIIEEYFGQYDEIYLTPLLRKLSELMDEGRYDPKDLISDLEDSGAVWLEKRPAKPHDYTVLLVDDQHPDVIAIREDFQEMLETDESYDRPYYKYDGYSTENGEVAHDIDYDDEHGFEPQYDGYDGLATSSEEIDEVDDLSNDETDQQRTTE